MPGGGSGLARGGSGRRRKSIRIGDTVYVRGSLAVIRWLGPRAAKKLVAGVEFVEYQQGDSDGTHMGEKLFSCETNCGTFIEARDVESVDKRHVAAAVSIQKLCRGVLARQAAAEQATFQIWNTLESIKEGETLARGKSVTKPAAAELQRQIKEDEEAALAMHSGVSFESGRLDNQQTAAGSGERQVGSVEVETVTLSGLVAHEAAQRTEKGVRRRSSLGLSARRMSRRLSSVNGIVEREIDENYRGPHLKWPMDRQFCLDLLDNFRENPDQPLPAKYVWEMMCQTEKLLKETVPGGVFYVEFPKKTDSRIVVVGDTHGQLNDVLWIFYKFGPPSPTNIYLFNGDIADRGDHAVEIFMLLFAFKLANPESVVINRGNHESADLNEVYGFAAEVRKKYCGKIYSKFQDIFHELPLCIVIEKRIVVVHGGLFRKDDVTLDMINNIDRKRPCPVSPRTVDDALLFDILWSDPQSDPGRGLSTRGVDCISFGHDVTANFLALNGLEVCIRSHQVPVNLRGFEPLHEGYCVTLFSASNYCGTTGNFGGVIIFEPDMAFEIQEYMAPKLEDIKTLHRETQQATKKVRNHAEVFKDLENRARVRNRRSSVINMQRDVLKKIARMVCEHKQSLWEKFRVYDVVNTGRVTPAQWRASCAEVMGSHLPWMFVQKHLHLVQVCTAGGTVTPTFGTPAEPTSSKAVDTAASDAPTGSKKSKKLKPPAGGAGGSSSAPPQQYILYHEFLNRFRVEFRPIGSQHENWRRETVQQVFESILQADLSLKETLMVFDRNCDGTVSYREFDELLTELDLGLTVPQVRLLMRVITSNYSAASDPAGRIDAAEFLGRFKVVYRHAVQERSPKERWVRSALEEIGKRILTDRKEAAQRHYETQQPIMNYDIQSRRRSSAVRAVALFQKFKEYNEGGDGFLSYNDFVRAIQKLPGISQAEKVLGWPLDEDHLIRLARAIDVTATGKINYLEFLDAFHVVDGSTSQANVADEMWNFICEILLRAKDSVTQTLFETDPSQSGKADVDDFRDALLAVNEFIGDGKQPLTADQIDSLVNCVDLDDEGLLNYDDFFDSFVVVDTQQADEESESNSEIDPTERQEIQALLFEEFAVEKNKRRRKASSRLRTLSPSRKKKHSASCSGGTAESGPVATSASPLLDDEPWNDSGPCSTLEKSGEQKRKPKFSVPPVIPEDAHLESTPDEAVKPTRNFVAAGGIVSTHYNEPDNDMDVIVDISEDEMNEEFRPRDASLGSASTDWTHGIPPLRSISTFMSSGSSSSIAFNADSFHIATTTPNPLSPFSGPRTTNVEELHASDTHSAKNPRVGN